VDIIKEEDGDVQGPTEEEQKIIDTRRANDLRDKFSWNTLARQIAFEFLREQDKRLRAKGIRQ